MKSTIHRAAFCLYTLLIAWASLQPTAGVPVRQWDKLGHLLANAIGVAIGATIALSFISAKEARP